MTPPGSDEGNVCAPHPLLWASPPHCHYARRPATPGISHSQPATTGRPLDSPPTRPRPMPAATPSPTAVPSRPRPTPAAETRPSPAARHQDQDHRKVRRGASQTKKKSREGRRRGKPPRQHSLLCCLFFPEDGEERRNCHVSTASWCCTVCSAVCRCSCCHVRVPHTVVYLHVLCPEIQFMSGLVCVRLCKPCCSALGT